MQLLLTELVKYTTHLFRVIISSTSKTILRPDAFQNNHDENYYTVNITFRK